MIGKRQFKKGQRVRLSTKGKTSNIVPKTRREVLGTVTKIGQSNMPIFVQWDGRTTHSSYHPDFLEPAR